MRKLLIPLTGIFLLMSFIPFPPQFSRSLDVYQGFNFNKAKLTPVGFITSLQIGKTTFSADITVKDPANAAANLPPVVAVMNRFLWSTAAPDALYLGAQISTPNKAAMQMILMQDMSLADVTISYVVYEYDPLAKIYYKSCFNVTTPLAGLLEKNGSDLNLSIADDPSTEIQTPRNFTFAIGIAPKKAVIQSISLASSSKSVVQKQWMGK